LRASTTSEASRSLVEVRKEFNPPLLARLMYRLAIAAALSKLPRSCEEGVLSITKLFHACTVQSGILSLVHRYRQTVVTPEFKCPLGFRGGQVLRNACRANGQSPFRVRMRRLIGRIEPKYVSNHLKADVISEGCRLENGRPHQLRRSP
jgi:hypothetical protein